MNSSEHTKPENLVKYAFYWSVARMGITGFFLLFGGMAIVRSIFFNSMQMVSLYQIFWLVSGIASLYLLYMWYKSDHSIYGGSVMQDQVAFWVMIVTGINQGLLGLGASGFSVSMLVSGLGSLPYWILGAAYLYFAFYNWQRWQANSESVVDIAPAPAVVAGESAHDAAPEVSTNESSEAQDSENQDTHS